MSVKVEWTNDEERLDLIRRRAAMGIRQNLGDVEWLMDRHDRAVNAVETSGLLSLALLTALATLRRSTSDHVLDEAGKFIRDLEALNGAGPATVEG